MLNISRYIYSGWNIAFQKYELPEAEIIPIGESANEKKRLDTIARKYATLREYQNVPLPGFTLYKTDRKNWSSTDSTWLIIDPRGVLVRISNQNLEDILHVTGITEGLIQERCVWARDDTQTKMILVPISSQKYIEAVQNTELIENKVDLKEVQIGDTVLLQNELQGVYMGVVSLYGPLCNYVKAEEYKPQVYLRRQVIEVLPGKYHYQTDLKILKVIKKSDGSLTREDSVKQMNDYIKSGTAFFTSYKNITSTYYSVHGMIKHVSTYAVPKVTMSFEEIDKGNAVALFYDGRMYSEVGLLALTSPAGRNCLVDYPSVFSSSVHPPTIAGFNTVEMQSGLQPCEKMILKEKKKPGYMSPAFPTTKSSIDDFKKYYKIVKHVKGESYI